MSTLEILDLVVRITTIISVLVAVTAIWFNAQVNRRQLNVSVVTKYSQRYVDIMDSFPADAFDARFNASELPPASKELTLCVLKYLNMA